MTSDCPVATHGAREALSLLAALAAGLEPAAPPGRHGALPGALIANDCFGRVAEHERLVLEDLIAGERCRTKPAAAAPPDQDPTDRVG